MATEVKPIRTEADHATAMEEVAALWGAATGTPEGNRLDVLATLIDAYEVKCHPIDSLDGAAGNDAEGPWSKWSDLG